MHTRPRCYRFRLLGVDRASSSKGVGHRTHFTRFKSIDSFSVSDFLYGETVANEGGVHTGTLGTLCYSLMIILIADMAFSGNGIRQRESCVRIRDARFRSRFERHTRAHTRHGDWSTILFFFFSFRGSPVAFDNILGLTLVLRYSSMALNDESVSFTKTSDLFSLDRPCEERPY